MHRTQWAPHWRGVSTAVARPGLACLPSLAVTSRTPPCRVRLSHPSRRTAALRTPTLRASAHAGLRGHGNPQHHGTAPSSIDSPAPPSMHASSTALRGPGRASSACADSPAGRRPCRFGVDSWSSPRRWRAAPFLPLEPTGPLPSSVDSAGNLFGFALYSLPHVGHWSPPGSPPGQAPLALAGWQAGSRWQHRSGPGLKWSHYLMAGACECPSGPGRAEGEWRVWPNWPNYTHGAGATETVGSLTIPPRPGPAVRYYFSASAVPDAGGVADY